MSTELFFSSTDSTPMYAQIMAQFVARIVAGDWGPGHPLPSIRELASQGKVSVITVKRAYLELEHAGIIVTRQGKGSFVAEAADLQRRLVQAEFDRQLADLLATARRYGLGREQVLRRVAEAWGSAPGAVAATVASRSREEETP
jgi:GntR family transcriptional regulator